MGRKTTTPPKFSVKDTTVLLDQVCDRLWMKHYSIRTKRAYVDWIKRHIPIHGKRAFG
jgi:hypothetical protein